MKPWAYYNEHDGYAAWWLRYLMRRGLIAEGYIDQRSIEDVQPNDLIGFNQVHLFAGIGVWSYALRRAGWSDDRSIWTASCPCQPFSAAGQGNGFADERHLWPAVNHLITVRRPRRVVGEQVASPDGAIWFDLVQTDLEALGYAVGACAFPAAGVGAPHIRDRNYWMADADDNEHHRGGGQWATGWLESSNHSSDVRLGDPSRKGLDQRFGHGGIPGVSPGTQKGQTTVGADIYVGSDAPGPTNGHWRDADWLGCTDGKWRPVEPGTFPLANGSSPGVGRVRADQGHRAGRLKGYGNALNAEAAIAFIRSMP